MWTIKEKNDNKKKNKVSHYKTIKKIIQTNTM